MLKCKVPTTIRGMGWEWDREQGRGWDRGQDREWDRGETGQNQIILGFRVPTYSGEVSPPPANRTTIPYTFTELQKAFVGPHHGPKSLGQKQPIDH